MEKTKEEELCGMLNEGRCVAGQELERARQVIRELREGRKKLQTDVGSLHLELQAMRACHKKDSEFLIQERDEAKGQVKEGLRVQKEFIGDCAALLGLPELDENTEYGGEAIRKGIMRLREALEKVNDIRNDIVGRQTMGWSAHIYPLVAALDNAGFKGMEYTEAREKIEATMGAARELAAQAWCSETTEQTEMDVVLAEEFAEILFPFLEALEFYGKLGNWQGMKDGEMECVCDREMGARARATLGRPDREVPGDEDEE